MIDNSTLIELYNAYKDSMYYRAYRILNDVSGAEDAVRNVFVRLMRSKNSIEIEDVYSYKTCAFMVIVCGNISKSMYNTRKNRGAIPIEEQKLMIYVDVPGESLLDSLIARELYDEIRVALNSLDALSADILRLKYFHDVRNTDIATLLGISRIDVGVKVMRGKKKLKILLERKGISFDA